MNRELNELLEIVRKAKGRDGLMMDRPLGWWENLCRAALAGEEAAKALAEERQYRDGHLPSCNGMDFEQGRCGCGYLDGTAYRELYESRAALANENAKLKAALAGEWRPIATAPRTGEHERVLIWDGQSVRAAYTPDPDDDDGRWLCEDGYFRSPTHWQPLPQPPKNEKE